MISRAALLLLPVLVFGQTQQPAQAPPPEVDQALRARVSEFLQYHVDANFRKAYELVAEDTKDYYFAANKVQLKDFKITGIEYSDNFTKAQVTTVITRMWRIHTEEEKVVVPMVTSWKVENGKWVWYFDEKNNNKLMSMGESDIDAIRKNAETAQMPDLSPEAMKKAAEKILKQSNVDKSQVTLATDKESVERVIFHNGYPGSVMLTANVARPVPGFSAELEKTSLGMGEDTVLELRYTPAGEPPKGPTRVNLRLQPFNQVFSVAVTFAARATEAPRQ